MANIPEHRKWMYNRLLPGKKGYTEEFLVGVEEFIEYASTLPGYELSNKIRCPCSKCKNTVHLPADDVRVHLYRKGFVPDYWIWTCHNELIPSVQAQVNDDPSENNWYEQMVFDMSGPSFIPFNVENDQAEEPHTSARNFYDLLNAARQPLSKSSVEETELSYAMMMMDIKTTYNIPQVAMDRMFSYNHRMVGPDSRVPSRYYDSKKLLSKLGPGYEKIDCCINSWMLYYKSDINDIHCKFCGEPRFKPQAPGYTRGKDVPRKKMHYLPLIPRLQRLYASNYSASHMRWHYENQSEHGIMCHPSDSEVWKHFDKKNRNSDCGGMGPSLHSGGSIPMTEHRRRLKEKLGEESSHAMLFQETHQSKKTGQYVCKKAQNVIDNVTQLKQTQPEVSDATAWLEATSGIKKGAIFGFGSDTEHYFPESVTHKRSKPGAPSSHGSCERKIKELEDKNREITEQHSRFLEEHEALKEQFQKMSSQFAIFSAHFHIPSNNEGNNGGLDETQPPLKIQMQVS